MKRVNQAKIDSGADEIYNPRVHSILVADDEADVLEMIQQELTAAGYYVSTANNGQTAISMARKQKPDLIILDVAMPVFTGIKVYEHLRNAGETKGIPVIFLTGLPSSNVYPTVMEGTRVAYLKKPVDCSELLSLIAEFLKPR